MVNPQREFAQTIQAAGLTPPGNIEPGTLHRFPGIEKPAGNRAGWCKLFSDCEGGIYGDWSTDFYDHWQAERAEPSTQAERAEFNRRIAEEKRKAEAERQQAQAAAAKKAAEVWAKAAPAEEHPYLKHKAVKPHGLRQSGNDLLVPVRNKQGELTSLQFIAPDGSKKFLSDGRIKNGYFSIGKPADVICVAEGFATGASVHEATEYAVAVAFNAGNLEPVAKAMRAKFPDARIIICGDNDESGIGQKKAKQAAAAVGGDVSIPPEVGDWNDHLAAHGPESTREALLCLLCGTKVGDSGKKPLPELPAVAPFEFDLLPDSLQPWARDIAARIQCAPDYVGVTIMAALGATLGRKVGIRPQEKTDWTEHPNQWALIIGRPGVLKSPAQDSALGPLKRLAAEAAEAHAEEAAGHKAEAKVAKLQEEAAEKAARAELKKNPSADVSRLFEADQPEPPTLKRYIANDTTAASLGELVRQNPNGLLVYRDEMVSLLKGLEREDAADARGFYLTGWNGNSPYTFDRIGRGMNLHIPAVCLSMLGSTQPGRIAEYLRQAIHGGSGDDGLIQRFGLLVWPDVSGEWKDVDCYPDGEGKRAAYEVFARLDQMEAPDIGADCDEYNGSHFLRFAPDALAEFRTWREGLEYKLRSGELHPALESHLAKYRKLVPSLALIIHLVDNGTGPVTLTATGKALAWAEYLETHAVRAYASVAAPEVQTAKAVLRRIEKGDIKSRFTPRDIYINRWANLSDSRQVRSALTLLADYGHLTTQVIDTGGRPSTVYEVVP